MRGKGVRREGKQHVHVHGKRNFRSAVCVYVMEMYTHPGESQHHLSASSDLNENRITRVPKIYMRNLEQYNYQENAFISIKFNIVSMHACELSGKP